MRNFKMLAGAFVVVSTFFCATARADDQRVDRDEVRDTKPGLIATGVILSVFGVGHVALAGAAFSSAASCGADSWCFKDLDNWAGGISLAIGGALLGVGIPLIVYGSTAKKPRAQVGFSSNGILLSGTF
jgi:hypothetical protein